MTCTKCGAEVPEGKIACRCFLVAVDNEIEALALKNFAKGFALYLKRFHQASARTRKSLSRRKTTPKSAKPQKSES